MDKECYFCDADGQCLMYCDMAFKMCDNCGKDDESEFDDEEDCCQEED